MEIRDGQTVGIDLGTTYSAIAQLDPDGNPGIINNADGRSITPSVVLLGDNGVIVGPEFERVSEEDPKKVVEAVKREMGNDSYFVVYKDQKLTPEFISAMIIKKLRQDAEKTIGPITNAVLTVPYYFNDVRRKATQDAGKIAGLNVLDIINEPTAATLSYAWTMGELGRTDLGDIKKTILVYDLGGGTFDVTIVEYTPTHFHVLATDGDVMLGGLDWSERIVAHISEQFMQKFGSNPRENPEIVRTLIQDCEKAKQLLSEQSQTPISVYSEGKTLTVSLTRADFERMTSDLLQRTKDTTELVIQQSGIDIEQLDEVVLVGGSTYMPVVEKMLVDITKTTPSRDVMPEAAVAQGAAIHAAILEAKQTGAESRMGEAILARLRAVTVSDVNSHSLGVKVTNPKTKNKTNHIMIPKNHSIPFSVSQKFVTTSNNQQRIHVYILEGEAADPDACTPIGDFIISNLPPNLKKGSPVEVTYQYDANGRIEASAKELTGSSTASIEIIRDSGLDSDGLKSFQTLAENYEIR